MKWVWLTASFAMFLGVAHAEDVWSLKTSIGHAVTHESAKGKVKYADERFIEFGIFSCGNSSLPHELFGEKF